MNETLVNMIAEIATNSILDSFAKYPEHDFYAAALSTIDDAIYISSSVNSLKNIDVIINSSSYYEKNDYSYIKWSPCEWGDFEYINHSAWKPVDSLLAKMYDEMHEDNFSEFRDIVFSSMVQSAKVIADRLLVKADRSIFVFATVYDSSDAGSMGKDSATLANPNHPMLAEFLDEAKEW